MICQISCQQTIIWTKKRPPSGVMSFGGVSFLFTYPACTVGMHLIGKFKKRIYLCLNSKMFNHEKNFTYRSHAVCIGSLCFC